MFRVDWRCRFCGKCFKSENKLIEHLDLCHGEEDGV